VLARTGGDGHRGQQAGGEYIANEFHRVTSKERE
jgi:hypothetical protein